MKERPILFSAPMVRAILDGTKTQTRRIVKGEALAWLSDPIGFNPELVASPENGLCPYGRPGDLLWVRENGWERPERTPQMMREGADTWAPYYYDADRLTEQDRDDFKAWGFKRRPSIHMPRWASRILLEIVSVRIERLQDISEADAIAEGGTEALPGWWSHEGLQWNDPGPRDVFGGTAIDSYRILWKKINGPGSWDANPWVWVVEFKRVQA